MSLKSKFGFLNKSDFKRVKKFFKKYKGESISKKKLDKLFDNVIGSNILNKEVFLKTLKKYKIKLKNKKSKSSNNVSNDSVDINSSSAIIEHWKEEDFNSIEKHEEMCFLAGTN